MALSPATRGLVRLFTTCRSADWVVPALSVLVSLAGTGSVVGELSVAELIRVATVTPEATATVTVKVVVPPTSRPEASVQVTVPAAAKHAQPVLPPPPLTNVSPLGRGSVTFKGPAASDGPSLLVTVKSYVASSPATKVPSCTLVSARSAKVTMVVGLLEVLLPGTGSLVGEPTEAVLVIDPGSWAAATATSSVIGWANEPLVSPEAVVQVN